MGINARKNNHCYCSSIINLLHMDRILVFDQGKIVEDGTHAKLLNKNGLYKTLWDTQVGGFLLDKKNGNE